jgi:putative PIN family toxin of toxin-antitoxin system
MYKVVLDTNLFVAAYFNKNSASAKIIDLCLKNKLKVSVSISLFRELEFILKNIRASREYKTKVYNIFNQSVIVEPKRVWAVKDDLDDNKFLGVACSTKAQYLITNDQHLLKLKKFNKTKIVKPVDFLEKYCSYC